VILANPDSNCNDARLYYYDFLREETKADVPPRALEHIRQCWRCKDEISRLEGLLARAQEDSAQRRRESTTVATLRLHFAYVGKAVACGTVKPFLSNLAVPDLEIGIPTPITIHLDNCRACSDDLLTLRSLGLNHKQLYRLGQLLADTPVEDTVGCSRARSAIPSVVSMVFRETSPEILKHLCVCPDCREELYQHREAVRKQLLHNEIPENGFPCETVSASDIYDYCFPYGIDPANDQYAKFRESLTSHLRTCPRCLSKMQQLHSKVCEITERSDSGVVTCHELAEAAEKPEFSDVDELYADWPIRVRVLKQQRLAGADKSARRTFPLKQKASALSLKPYIKPAFAAAAVILVGLALLLNTSTAKAVTFEQICRAIKNVKNVYIARYNRGQTEPAQERWVSRTLKIHMSKVGGGLVLLDVLNGVRRTKDSNTGSIETTPLSYEMITTNEKAIAGFWGLVPFSDLSVLAKDAAWNSVADDDLEAAGETEIYELTWTDKANGGSVVFRKWRVFVDPTTNLPQRTEFYQRLAADGEYTLDSVILVEYLSDGEMETVVKEASF
jgi:hypothetical protein